MDMDVVRHSRPYRQSVNQGGLRDGIGMDVMPWSLPLDTK